MACEKCGGSGWRVIEREGLSAAEPCDCGPAETPQDLEAIANIPPRYEHASVDSFRIPEGILDADRSALQQILLTVRTWAREFPFVAKPGLLFVGGVGTGKTHLAVAALRLLLQKGIEGVFYDYISLLEHIRSGYDSEANASDREAYQKCLDVPVLLIDDLGSHRILDWIEDTITAIVTHRCNYKKALIVTTNIPDEYTGDNLIERRPDLPRPLYKTSLTQMIGIRARSRLHEMCQVVRMPALRDYRETKR